GSDFFANSIFTHPNNIAIVEAEFSLNPSIKLLPAILSFFGAALAIYMYHIQPQILINLTFDTSTFQGLPALVSRQAYPKGSLMPTIGAKVDYCKETVQSHSNLSG